MLEDGLPAPVSLLEAFLIYSVGGVGVDLVVQNMVVVGAVEAVWKGSAEAGTVVRRERSTEVYGQDLLHRLARTHHGSPGGSTDNTEEDIVVDGDQAQGTVDGLGRKVPVVAEIGGADIGELDHAARGVGLGTSAGDGRL